MFIQCSVLCPIFILFAACHGLELVLEDEYFAANKVCTSEDVPIMFSPFFTFIGNDLALKTADTTLTFNLVLASDFTVQLIFPLLEQLLPQCEQKSSHKLELIPNQGNAITLLAFDYYYFADERKHFIEYGNGLRKPVKNWLKCIIKKDAQFVVCKDFATIFDFQFDFTGSFVRHEEGKSKPQVLLKHSTSTVCPLVLKFPGAKLVDRRNTAISQPPPPPPTTTTTTTTSTMKTVAITETTTSTAEETTTELVSEVKTASSTNNIVIIIFSIIGVILLWMAAGVAVYFIYKRCKKEKHSAPQLSTSQSMPVSLLKMPVLPNAEPVFTTPEVIMDPKQEDKTQSLSKQSTQEAGIDPAIKTEVVQSSAPVPAEPTLPSPVTVDQTKSLAPVATATPKVEKEESKHVDLPPLVIEKPDNYTKIKKTEFDRGQEDSMASEEGCGNNILKLEPLVMAPLAVTDALLESYPADYVEKMALRKATIADRAAMHLQAVIVASNALLKKGFKNDGNTLTGSDALMDWLKSINGSPFLQFVAECVEVRPDVSSPEFNASKIQWRRYLKKIDLVETFRHSCWLGQTQERREFFLLATFFKLEQLAQQYSSDDLKMYPFPVPYLLEIRSEAPHFFKIDDSPIQKKNNTFN
uniref:Peptidase S72 domain-containing protein n=1 Tax=Panagrellus redivivus TaxID=6233 RepID=A0A7E4W630_PANRE